MCVSCSKSRLNAYFAPSIYPRLGYIWRIVSHPAATLFFRVSRSDFCHYEAYTAPPNMMAPSHNGSFSSFSQQPLHHYRSIKLSFHGIHPSYPGRVVFSYFPDASPLAPRTHALRKIFINLQNKAGSGRLGEADRSMPSSRMRIIEATAGLFVVQIRGGLNDCATPALNIDFKNHEVSCDWKDLFTQYFQEKRVASLVLENEGVRMLKERHDYL